MQFNSILPMDMALSGATTRGQNGPGSDGNEGVHRFPQNSSIIRTSPSDCLLSYIGHSLVGGLSLYIEAVGVFYSPDRLGKDILCSGEWEYSVNCIINLE